MRIDDFIIFGRTVPEESKKHGKCVCMAGYSPELRQLMRIYPLTVGIKLKARQSLMVLLERNQLDSRIESWTLKGRSPLSILNVSPVVSSDFLKMCLEKNLSDDVDSLNFKKKSLGILKAEFSIEMRVRNSIKDLAQRELFHDFYEMVGFKTAKDYFTAPYVRLSTNGRQKYFQIREWGLYELMRKYEQQGKAITETDIKKSLFLQDNRDVFFVIGNMNHARNTWIIIKTFSFKKNLSQLPLFP